MISDIAHICNRGVERRKIFMDRGDYSRFRDNLLFLNNVKGKIRTREADIRNINNLKQEKLVEVFKWCLLPNHYHLLVYEVVEGGILEFTKRLGNAYTKYFNTKNEGRSGYLFQNKAQIVPIKDNKQFMYIPCYIDWNILDLKFQNWKTEPPTKAEAKNFLRNYEWSSYKDYFGDGDRDCIINKNLFYDLFDFKHETYEDQLLKFIRESGVSTWQVDTIRGL